MPIKREITEMHTRTDSVIQFNFLKGTYYNTDGQYDDNIVHNMHILLKFLPDEATESMLEEFTNLSQHLKNLFSKRWSSQQGHMYLEIREKRELDNEIKETRTRISRIRGDFISFNVRAMQNEKIMEKPVTRMQLEKLPLLLKGGTHQPMLSTDDDEADFDEEI